MSLVADTHVHVYPGFPLGAVFTHAIENLDVGSGDHAGIFLTEREGEHWFRDLATGKLLLPAGLFVEPSVDGELLWLRDPAGQRLLVSPGRQFVSAERIEILCLTADLDLADGAPASDILSQVLGAGGVPVLPWSPGKWTGKRGRLVHELIAAATLGDLLIGDTAMRPRLARRPSAMRAADARGMACLAGTDPLPLPGDETIIGRYATVMPFDPERPLLEGIRSTLTDPSSPLDPVGRRSPLVRSIKRWIALQAS